MSEPNWDDIRSRLAEPFNPEDVDFRGQTSKGEDGRAQAVCYVDARTVMDRLDAVVGPGAWSFTYEPLIVANGQVQVAKGALTVHGVTKEDIGEASNFDPSKGCVSDALKRAAVLWGIGRYLYSIGGDWVTLEKGRITPGDLKRLRAKLPRPGGAAGGTPGGTTSKPRTEIAPGESAPPQESAPVSSTKDAISKLNLALQDYGYKTVAVRHKWIADALTVSTYWVADAEERGLFTEEHVAKLRTAFAELQRKDAEQRAQLQQPAWQ